MKIGVCETVPVGACSFYRSIGPLTKLRQINKNIEIKTIKEVNWNSLFDIDILFLARPDSKAFSKMAEMAKKVNVPVWVDWDDNIFDIEKSNPAYKHYAKTEIVENTKKCLQVADVITVSTENIKNYFLKYNENVVVVENSLNDYHYKLKKVSNQYNSIFWRGSNTHRDDLLSVKKEIMNTEKNNPDWTWVFIGGDPWYITNEIENKFKIDEIDIVTYFKFLKDNRSCIAYVPLVVNDFNKSKSNIGWIEGTLAGSAVLAPMGLPEFDKPGIVQYNPEKEGSFQYYLEKMIKSKEFRIKKYTESFDYINENLLLSEINKKRISIMESLI